MVVAAAWLVKGIRGERRVTRGVRGLRIVAIRTSAGVIVMGRLLS